MRELVNYFRKNTLRRYRGSNCIGTLGLDSYSNNYSFKMGNESHHLKTVFHSPNWIVPLLAQAEHPSPELMGIRFQDLLHLTNYDPLLILYRMAKSAS